jgi:hypothetical protein
MSKITGYLLVALHSLILLFAFFQSGLVFPPWMQSFGRVHPLLLHLPIGALLVVVALVFFGRRFANDGLLNMLLAFTALCAAFTALMGIVLSAEEGYEHNILNVHMIAGVLTSLFCWATYFVHSMRPSRPVAFKWFLIGTTVALTVAGHFGSVITHGDQFVLSPILAKGTKSQTVTDSTSLFRAAVYPILEYKCAACHNDNKKKGKLSMTSAASLLAGGESGPPWINGEPRKSILMSRILLPENHKDHMPPQGKPQLNITEVNLLYQWIQSGADTTLAWSQYPPTDTVRKLAHWLIGSHVKEERRNYNFEPASDETVSSLNDPFLSVSRIALHEPALVASFYIRQEYRSDRLKDLLAVKKQIVDLNLDGMPVTDEDCLIISNFENLEKLNLNSSQITGTGLHNLSKLTRLQSISIAGTGVDDAALLALKDFPSLKKVYIWNTAVADPASLVRALPAIHFDTGAPQSESEILRLSPPMLSNDETIVDNDSVRFDHNLPGVLIRYAVGGGDPDSISSPVFREPLAISSCTEVKAIACKPGWYCSRPSRFLFFKKGMTPAEVSLNARPDKDYRGEGSKTITDNKKGFAENYRGDAAWLGYREEPFDATFSFAGNTAIHEIVVSYARNTPSFLFPPAAVEVWGGSDINKFELLREIRQAMPADYGRTQIEAIRIPLDGAQFRHYRVVVRPFAQLPTWHHENKKETKDKRTWVFIDEIFFN